MSTQAADLREHLLAEHTKQMAARGLDMRDVGPMAGTPLRQFHAELHGELHDDRDYRHTSHEPRRATMTTFNPDGLVEGQKYRIHTRTGSQKNAREHVLTYLGRGGVGGEGLIFNARPFAGTQEFAAGDIVAMWDLGKGAGRDDPGHYMNRVVRGETRVF